MTTRTAPSPWPEAADPGVEEAEIPLLHNGDRLKQPEFHRRYEAMPPGVKAELIGGIVYMASPVGPRHAKGQIRLGTLLCLYEIATPGVEALDNATVVLSSVSEPQPDLHVRLLPAYGGRVRPNTDGMLSGGPELVAEVADSSESIDLHGKRHDYQRAGVLEYLVFLVRENGLRAFDLTSGRERPADPDGIYRSRTFPGLWIDAPALTSGDMRRAIRTLNRGLKSPEHNTFVRRLKAAAAKAAGTGKGTPTKRRKRKGQQ